jgi:apolipoprotein N-acyltransferase
LQQAALPPSPKSPAPLLIVLPETVLPIFQDRIDASIWELWLRTAQAQRATIIMGVPLHQKHNGLSSYTNSAIGFDGNTTIQALRTGHLAMRYDKHHLVPWGEFVPPAFHWLVRLLNIPLGDFDQGRLHQAPFDIADQRVALNICYENLFGEELLSAIRTREGRHYGASIFLNLSNLGWFGHSWALRQHLQISRMRALETARPFLTATNTGISAAINAQGHVIAQAPAWQATTLNTTVQGMTGLTPYARIGNLLIGAVAIIMLLGLTSLRIAESYAARRQKKLERRGRTSRARAN